MWNTVSEEGNPDSRPLRPSRISPARADSRYPCSILIEMQCSEIFVLVSACALYVCLASGKKVKEKKISKPVRLITEEELAMYDGSRVMKLSLCVDIRQTFKL